MKPFCWKIFNNTNQDFAQNTLKKIKKGLLEKENVMFPNFPFCDNIIERSFILFLSFI